jgi:hypothetical protein
MRDDDLCLAQIAREGLNRGAQLAVGILVTRAVTDAAARHDAELQQGEEGLALSGGCVVFAGVIAGAPCIIEPARRSVGQLNENKVLDHRQPSTHCDGLIIGMSNDHRDGRANCSTRRQRLKRLPVVASTADSQ